LSGATIEALEGNAVRIAVGDAVQAQIAREKSELVERALAEALGVPLRALFVSPDGGASRTANARASVERTGDEPDLLAYARAKLGGVHGS
ncbi:MAG: hypothetical protein ACREM2_12550, partial [Vulcanimicrobiaceae bacterium]